MSLRWPQANQNVAQPILRIFEPLETELLVETVDVHLDRLLRDPHPARHFFPRHALPQIGQCLRFSHAQSEAVDESGQPLPDHGRFLDRNRRKAAQLMADIGQCLFNA